MTGQRLTPVISVVVAVYNPADLIERCIDGYLAQSLPSDQREIIFVDDGSTDETPDRLDQLAAQHDDVRVFHEPNSGWPGRPRNIGIDAARGEFVFFCDHDDWLSPEGLERMVVTARRTDADVLVPKMVGHGRRVPGALFRTNIDNAELGVDPLMSSLTPHKLVRRAFLDEHAIRFAEGKRRLEDHLFVTTAYLRARVITVLSDYPTYHHGWRDDRGNAARQEWDPASYYGYLREVLDVIDAGTTPGDLRDDLMSRAYHSDMMRRLRGRKLLSWGPAIRKQALHEIRTLAIERYAADYAERFAIVPRAHARAVLASRLDQLIRLAEAESDVRLQVHLRGLAWNGNGWTASVEAELIHDDGSPVVVEPTTSGWSLDRRILPSGFDSDFRDRDDILRASLDIVVRNRSTDVQWYVSSRSQQSLVPVEGSAGAHRVVVRADADINPTTLAGGAPLEPGVWVLRVSVGVFGIKRAAAAYIELGESFPLPHPGLFPMHRTVVVPRCSQNHRNLVFRVNSPKKSRTASLVKRTSDLTVSSSGQLRAPISATIAAESLALSCTLTLEGLSEAGQLSPDSSPVARRFGTIEAAPHASLLTCQLLTDTPLSPGSLLVTVQVDPADAPLSLGVVEVGRGGIPTNAELRLPASRPAKTAKSSPAPHQSPRKRRL